MFLLIDIGNTSIKLGLCTMQGKADTYVLPTNQGYTADSLGLCLITMLHHRGLVYRDVEACLACSVVPGLDPILKQACERFLHLSPLCFPRDLPVPLDNHYANPHEVGADRLLGAFAARRLFPEPASIVAVDFGTATTFDCVSGSAYVGGLICPGMLSSHAALASQTAKLPRISLQIEEDAPLIGRDTPTSMNHGFMFGFAAMTEGLCERLKHSLPGPVKIVGTGGFAADIARVSRCLDAVVPNLILDGLRLAWRESHPLPGKNSGILQEKL